VNRDREKKKS